MHCNKTEVNEENDEGGRGVTKTRKNLCDTSPPHFFNPPPCPPVKVSQFVKRCVEIWSDIFFSLKNFFVTFFYTERERGRLFFIYVYVSLSYVCIKMNFFRLSAKTRQETKKTRKTI